MILKKPKQFFRFSLIFCILAYSSYSFGRRSEMATGGSRQSPISGSPNSQLKDPSQLQSHAISEPFKENFDKCTQEANMGSDCKFQDLGVMGDKSHQARASCHNSGQAIDVGFIQCGAQKIEPTDQKYCEFVKCFADGTEQTNTIFARPCGQNNKQKSDHDKHVHIQLKDCRMVAGGGK